MEELAMSTTAEGGGGLVVIPGNRREKGTVLGVVTPRATEEFVTVVDFIVAERTGALKSCHEKPSSNVRCLN
jgi:hypothetical protein